PILQCDRLSRALAALRLFDGRAADWRAAYCPPLAGSDPFARCPRLRAADPLAHGKATAFKCFRTRDFRRSFTVRLILGADHAGYQLLDVLRPMVADMAEVVATIGATSSEDTVDYPDIAIDVAKGKIGRAHV